MKQRVEKAREGRRGNERSMNVHQNHKGFTLIELMVVIAIIGLLSSVVLSTLVEAREGARDAKRIQEMRQIHNALEMYKNRTGGYPPSSGSNYNTDCGSDTSFENALQPLVDEGILPRAPTDPAGVSPHCFFYKTPGYRVGTNEPLCGSNNTAEYILVFRTETSEFNLKKWDVNGDFYCLTPPK